MILNLISLSSVKTQLGIAIGTTTYDASITALIPIVSSDIRRILNCSFDDYIGATITSGSNKITLDSKDQSYDFTGKELNLFSLGQVIYSPVLSDDTYLSGYDHTTGQYTISAAAIGNGEYVTPSVDISMFPTISKMIWYKLSKQNTTDSIARGIQSESYGPVSISYSAREINKMFDYPETLISDLGMPYARIG